MRWWEWEFIATGRRMQSKARSVKHCELIREISHVID
jgi:hypothetical protein